MSTVIFGEIDNKSFKTLIISNNNKVLKVVVEDGNLIMPSEPKDGYLRITIKTIDKNTSLSSSIFMDGEWVEQDINSLDLGNLRQLHQEHIKWLMCSDKKALDYPKLTKSQKSEISKLFV